MTDSARHARLRPTRQPRLSSPIYAPLRLQLDSRVSSVDSRGFVTLRIRGAARSSAQSYASLSSSAVLRAVSTPRAYLRALMFFTRETSRNAVGSSTYIYHTQIQQCMALSIPLYLYLYIILLRIIRDVSVYLEAL